jgi:hypothetical protein
MLCDEMNDEANCEESDFGVDFQDLRITASLLP